MVLLVKIIFIHRSFIKVTDIYHATGAEYIVENIAFRGMYQNARTFRIRE